MDFKATTISVFPLSIRYNLEGDLLFSVAKDSKPTVWYSSNGERLGTFNGHNGAIWCIDISRDTSRILTGSADNSTRLWDCETGTTLSQFETGSAVRSCMFSYSSNLFVYTTDATMGSVCEIYLYDIRDLEAPVRVIPIEGSRISAAVWGPFDEFLVTGHENGAICRYDVTRSGHCLQSVKEHKALISDLQASSDQIMIVTASKDNTSKLMDSENLEVLKTYRTERPVNSAAISPLKDHVSVM
jgi:translation initiation factor 3 subunit I